MNKLIVQTDQGTETISRHIFGHFAEHLGHCIYGGFWVGEDSDIPNVRGIRTDVVEALKATNIPVLRWPGGCFADEYHWRDGIGPRSERPRMINTHWGGVTEDNSFGTHEFMDLCDQLGCEPYICGNVGSGTVYEMQQWVEYLTLNGISPMADLRKANGHAEPWPLTYWGVGNENWGCGGHMRPEYYADLYRRYATYVRNYGKNVIYKIACGASGADYRWTEVLMREAADQMHGLSLHYYTRLGAAPHRGSATTFGEPEWFQIMNRAMYLEELLTKHSAIMDVYDAHKTVGLMVDEWGTWYEVEPGTNPGFLYQQNSLRDALVAGISLNAFCNHADRVQMANIAQTVNVLQAMILTDGPRMVLTPTYHVFDMFKVHQDAVLLPSQLTSDAYRMAGIDVPSLVRRSPDMRRDTWDKVPSTMPAGAVPQISATVSKDAEGSVHISLCNLDPTHAADLMISLHGMRAQNVTGTVLTDENMTAHNTFDDPEALSPGAFSDAKIKPEGIVCTLPAKSVVVLEVKG